MRIIRKIVPILAGILIGSLIGGVTPALATVVAGDATYNTLDANARRLHMRLINLGVLGAAGTTSFFGCASGTCTISRADSGTVTVTTADDNANANTVYQAGGTGTLTIGASTNGALTLLNDGTAITLKRGTSGAVTLTAADDDATAALVVKPGGAAALTLGDASATTGVTVAANATGNSAFTVPASSIAVAELTRPGFGRIRICGDATTVNNNTIYYGPDFTIQSSATVGTTTCNTTAAGNATEATADSPAFTGTAFGVTSMICYSDNPGVAAGLSFTLRNNAAATVPSVTCSIANGAAGTCVANIQTTTDIASGNPIAVAVASTGDVGTVHFICDVNVVF